MSTHSNLRGIGCMALATAAFVANDSLMKLALAEMPPFEVVIGRGVSAVLCSLAILAAMGLLGKLHWALNPFVVLRAFCEGFALIGFIVLLARIPIGDLTAIMQVTPLLVVGAGAFFFGDRLGPIRILLILVGFAGAILVAQPGSATGLLAAPVGLLAATMAAARDVLSRRVPPEVPGLVTAFTTVSVVLFLGLVVSFLFETRVWPSGFNALMLAAAGLLVVFGHLLVFLAFRFGAAGAVAPFSYLAAVFAVLAGLFAFGEVPGLWSVAGMLLIVLSGLAIIALGERERRRLPEGIGAEAKSVA